MQLDSSFPSLFVKLSLPLLEGGELMCFKKAVAEFRRARRIFDEGLYL
jgi:hypothetical protein